MKFIKTKLDFITFCIIACVATFSYLAYKEYKQVYLLQKRILFSFDTKQFFYDLKVTDQDADTQDKLNRIKKMVEHDARKTTTSDLIQALNAKNEKVFAIRKQAALDYERRYYFQANYELTNHQKKFQYYIKLALIIPGILFLGLYLFIRLIVMEPLKKLSQRMMDFLMDKYTFQFIESPNNEIGDLQRTFHSLAQRVINTMHELRDLDRAKSEFVSITSHELRTPLTSIKGSLGLLSGGVVGSLDEESKSLVTIAESETDRLIRLINDLLDLAKMESRSFSLKKNWISLKELLETTSDRLQGFAHAAEVKLKIISTPLNYDIYVDSDRIQQVITNLVSNAIKYSPKNDFVSISIESDQDNCLLISVKDNGRGISISDQEIIFEKFRQASNPTNPLVKGTGLGLAISKALVEEHGGKIGVFSKVGQGAKFYFSLPQWRLSEQNHKNAA